MYSAPNARFYILQWTFHPFICKSKKIYTVLIWCRVLAFLVVSTVISTVSSLMNSVQTIIFIFYQHPVNITNLVMLLIGVPVFIFGESIIKNLVFPNSFSSLVLIQASQFLRVITFYSTQLPGPNYHCLEVGLATFCEIFDSIKALI